MKKWTMRIVAVLTMLCFFASASLAEGVLSTTVVMRVSRMTQDAIVHVGEDLSMEVLIDGVTASSYQWYFNDQPISGANQRVYNIVNAQVDDAGTYRLDAFGEDGRMVLSMDIAARVIDDTVPKSGDPLPGMGAALAVMGIAVVLLIAKVRRYRKA